MRISDWSSDVCSSDLGGALRGLAADVAGEQRGAVGIDQRQERMERAIGVPQRIGAERLLAFRGLMHLPVEPDITTVAVGEERRSELRMIERDRHDDALRLGAARHADAPEQLGRAACRERVWQYV